MNRNIQVWKSAMDELSCCVIIPTYNNGKTLLQVIYDVSAYATNIVVINDGSTDSTSLLLEDQTAISVVEYEKNIGKGNALKIGLEWAQENGFSYAISIDSDGQHFASDIPQFIEAIRESPNSLIIGSRNLHEENMPKKNTFGNKFSNFWVKIETGLNLPDTQSGFRLYPIDKLKDIRLFTKKYEFEIEIMVKLAWHQVPVVPVLIKVYYPEGSDRVTHFRPFWDFVRIGFLNTYLVTLALLWHTPKRIIKKINRKSIKTFIQKNIFNAEESRTKIALSVALGGFMGVIPIWGYQLASALILAHFFKLNKAMVGLAANVSIPPFIPFILYGSLKTGQLLLGTNPNIGTEAITFDSVQQHLTEYLVGSFVFSFILAIVFGFTAFLLVTINRYKRTVMK